MVFLRKHRGGVNVDTEPESEFRSLWFLSLIWWLINSPYYIVHEHCSILKRYGRLWSSIGLCFCFCIFFFCFFNLQIYNFISKNKYARLKQINLIDYYKLITSNMTVTKDTKKSTSNQCFSLTCSLYLILRLHHISPTNEKSDKLSEAIINSRSIMHKQPTPIKCYQT